MIEQICIPIKYRREFGFGIDYRMYGAVGVVQQITTNHLAFRKIWKAFIRKQLHLIFKLISTPTRIDNLNCAESLAMVEYYLISSKDQQCHHHIMIH